MRKSTVVIILTVIMAIAIPLYAFASPSGPAAALKLKGIFGIDYSNLNDNQKADVRTYSQKMADLRKEFIDKMVSNGALTKEQGDAEKGRIDEALKAAQERGTAFGFGLGAGKGAGGRTNGFIQKIVPDTSKLSDEQKADLEGTQKKMADLHNEYIDKAVSFGLITEDQGSRLKSKLDSMAGAGRPGCFAAGFMMEFAADSSKLSEEQKAELEGYSKRMAELRQEMIDKLTSYGVLTKEQGDAALNRIEEAPCTKPGIGFSNGMGMMRKGGRFNRMAPRGEAGVANGLTKSL